MNCNPNYEMASVHFAPTVAEILNQATELLDYGAGKGRPGQTPGNFAA